MKALTVKTGLHATCLITLAAGLFAGCATVPDEGGAEVVPGPLSPQHGMVYGQVKIDGEDIPGLRLKAVFVQEHGDSKIEHECWCDADGTFAKVNLPADDTYYVAKVRLYQGPSEIGTLNFGRLIPLIRRRLHNLGVVSLRVYGDDVKSSYEISTRSPDDDLSRSVFTNPKYASWYDVYQRELGDKLIKDSPTT